MNLHSEKPQRHSQVLRQWLVRATTLIILLLLASFIFIFIRGLMWSPNEINKPGAYLELGVTDLVHHQGQRLWVTKFSEEQKAILQTITSFVADSNGCQLQQEICWIQSETERQGVVIRFIKNKPEALSNETPWVGGFINPLNGAVYDLSGRYYRESTRDGNAIETIHFIDK